jgi:hypothetical protein
MLLHAATSCSCCRALRLSPLYFATKLEHASKACQAAFCSSALDVRDKFSGFRLNGYAASDRLRLGLPAGPANAPALRCD